MSTIEEQNQILEKTKEQFIKEMEEAQVEFEDTLDNLAITTGGFHEFNDIKKFEEIANDVESVNQRIAENIAQAKLFNTQEFLVGKEQKDYSRLDQMAKQFKPYSDLWLTIRKWHNSHDSWMNDPWEQLDAEDLQDTYDNSKKTIGQVFNKFKSSEHQKIFEICKQMKGKIDDFSGHVPLAVSLRKEGM
jgi:dynein heavy chain